jgi:hypothetical protein
MAITNGQTANDYNGCAEKLGGKTSMKRFGWMVAATLVLMLASAPAWAVKKVTVAELTDMLKSMHEQKKTDIEVAAALKQVEMSEQLTRPAMNSMTDLMPGPLSTEQVYVLEAKSAILLPPADDLPKTAAPDAAAQKALLDKAVDYSEKTYAQLPHITATKTTVRFQDNVEAAVASSGMHAKVTTSDGFDSADVQASAFVHYMNSTENKVDISKGVEENPLAKDKTRWGENRMIALLGNGPALGTVIQEAQAAGRINFVRWEDVNGKPAQVYSFSVDKKQTHYAVNYCCFPDADIKASTVNVSKPSLSGSSAGPGNFQNNVTWSQFKATVPYHGEVFIDPDSGIVVRLVTQAEFKNNAVVHQEDQRIDYAPVAVGAKTMVLPMKTFVLTEVVPNGESQGSGKFTTRHTFFTAEYTNYQPGS